jgi:hypothetical protein
MVTIELHCKSPKRLAGDYKFSTFESLWKWINLHFKRPKGQANFVLWAVAKDRYYDEPSLMKVTSDVEMNYCELSRLVQDVGFLRRGSHLPSRVPNKGLEFAKGLDNLYKR